MNKKHRRSIFGPLLLLSVGIFLLLNNMGIVPGSSWEVILRLWPLILVLAGLDALYQGDGYVGAVLVIGIGNIFLMGNLGYINADPWNMLLRFWPVLLVAAGLDLVIGRRSVISALLGILLGLGLIAGILWGGGVLYPGTAPLGKTENINITLQAANKANVAILDTVGELQVAGPTEPANLLEGVLHRSSGEQLSQNYVVRDGRGDLKLENRSISISTPFSYTGSGNSRWEMRLNSAIPIDLTTRMIIGQQVTDLTNLKVVSITSQTIIGEQIITLPRAALHGDVKVVIGSLVLMVPRGMRISISADTGLTSIALPQGYSRKGHIISSAGTTGVDPEITFNIEQPLGSLTIREIP
jgi:hypothetical protein